MHISKRQYLTALWGKKKNLSTAHFTNLCVRVCTFFLRTSWNKFDFPVIGVTMFFLLVVTIFTPLKGLSTIKARLVWAGDDTLVQTLT